MAQAQPVVNRTNPNSRRSRQAAYLWTAEDTVVLARTPVGLAIAWLVPERRWDDLATYVARRRVARRRAWAEGEAAHLRRVAGDRLGNGSLAAIVEGQVANYRLRQLQILRCHRPGAWRPRFRLTGREHVEAALARGRGAILWVAPFAFASLVTKMTCHDAGLEVSHLSRAYHGYSASRLGMRLLNPVQRRAEDRYLAERIVIGAERTPVAAMRLLARRLRENRVVSITVGAEGVAGVTVPFLAGQLRLANGPAKLALSTGAPLLPVFTVREPDGGFLTTIEPPLPGGNGDGDAALAMIRAYANRLEPHALAAPEQFFWRDPIVRADGEAGPS